MRLIRFFLLLSLALLSACQTQTPTPLPTVTPSATLSPTPTITPTRTPFPTLEPSATPFQTISDDPKQQSRILIVHAASNVAALDVYVERLALINGIGYGQKTTPSPVISGTYTLSIVPTGGRLDDGALLKIPLEVQGQQTYVLVIYGSNADLKAQIIPLDVAPLKKTETRIRLFNTFIDGGPVRLVNTTTESDVLGETAASALSLSQAIPATTTNLQVRAGTIPLADLENRFNPLTSSLLILAGVSTDRATMKLIPVEGPVTGEGRVSILGSIEGLSDLDVYANDTLLIQSIGTNVLSESVTLPAGAYNLTLYPTGADRTTTDPITGTEVRVGPDDDVIVALYGAPDSISFATLVEDVSPTAVGRARIVFFNPVSRATHVRVSSDVLQEIVPINYGRFSEAFDVPARMTSFIWTQTDSRGDVETLESALDLNLKAGESYIYVFDARGQTQFDFLHRREVLESLNVISAAITPTPLPATSEPLPRLRMINALSNQFVEFRLDDAPVVRGLPFANASASILTPAGERTLTAHSSDGTQLLARLGVTLEPSKYYSAFLYGDQAPYNLMLIEDRPLFDLTAPAFRVINLSTDSRQVGAAIAPYFPMPPTEIVVGTPDPDAPEGYSVPGGIKRLADDLPPNTATDFEYLSVTAPQTIYILNADANLVNMTVDNLTFTPNMSYEIVIFKGINRPVQAFVVSYPPA